MQSYSLTDLPYSYDALQPIISNEIMELHHDKHHAGYVNGTNASLEKLAKARAGELEISHKAIMRDLSFNLNGHLMHELFWTVMQAPKSDNKPNSEILSLIDTNFNSFDAFKTEFAEASKTVEGSGWAVLGIDSNKNMAVFQLEKHNFLGIAGFTPILANDVWEHAYYLDYKNDRGAYVNAWWDVVNWDEVLRRAK
jgi:superoxide dismutase, Fe-Mn family